MNQWIHVKLDVDLLDALDVECDILTISRHVAIADGVRLWLAEIRRRQTSGALAGDRDG